jgi:hypothetical protein
MAAVSVLLHVLFVSSSFVLVPYFFDLFVLSAAHFLWLGCVAIGVPHPPAFTLNTPFTSVCHVILNVTLVVIYACYKAEDILNALARIRRKLRSFLQAKR